MIVVVCNDHGLAGVVAEFVGAGEPVITSSKWMEIPAHARVCASACVFGTSHLDEGSKREIREIREQCEYLPIVLIMPESRVNARALADVPPVAVVWLDDLSERLPIVLRRERGYRTATDDFAHVLAILLRAAHPVFRTAIIAAVRSNGRFPSKSQLSRQAATSSYWLGATLQKLVAPTPRFYTRLRIAALTLHAYDLAVYHSAPLSHAAVQLGVDQSVIRRAIRSVTGRTFKTLRRLPREAVLRSALSTIGIDQETS